MGELVGLRVRRRRVATGRHLPSLPPPFPSLPPPPPQAAAAAPAPKRLAHPPALQPLPVSDQDCGFGVFNSRPPTCVSAPSSGRPRRPCLRPPLARLPLLSASCMRACACPRTPTPAQPPAHALPTAQPPNRLACRYHRLMCVIRSMSTTPAGQASASAQQAQQQGGPGAVPLWLSDAEYQTKVRAYRWRRATACTHP